MKTDAKKIRGLSTALCLLSGAALAQAGAPAQETAAAPAQLSAGADAAPAQDATPVTAAAPAVNSAGIQEVVVTATRRATRLQKVAATIDVAQAEKLDALNLKDSAGMETLVPGVTVARSGGVTPFIRGIGTFNAGFSESSVGAYIDGIYLPNSTGVLFSFNNIERIEVLKGPQGTLYGRNTTGGLINIITKAPEPVLGMDASVGYASYDTLSQNVYVTGPVTDDVSANIAVYHQKQGRGWSRNVFTGNDAQKSEDTGAYSKVQWKVDRDTKVTLSGLYNRNESSKGWAFAIAPGTYGLDGTPYLGEYKFSNRNDPSATYEGSMAALKVEHQFGFADFFSLTGYQYGHQDSFLSQNGIPGNAVAGQSSADTYISFNNHTFSQEFQLSSKAVNSPFDWIAGAFYYHDNTDVLTGATTTCVAGICAPLPGNLPPTLVDTQPTTRSSSVYGDGTYSLSKATRLTLGLRYTREEKGFAGSVTPRAGFPYSATTLPASVVLSPAAAGLPPSVTSSKLTYRALFAQDFSDTVRGYISNNLGFKSGNYNPNSVTNPPVRPELLNATEVGLKSELFERKVNLNLSAFHYKYTDIQVRSNAGLPPGSVSVALNVASALTNGLDAQIDFKPLRGLTFNAGFEYLDAKYQDYPGATCTTPRVPTAAVLGGVASVACNLAGSPLPMSPKYSLVLGFSYELATDVGTFNWVGNDSYKSRYSFVPDNTLQQRPMQIIDTSVKWKLPNSRFDVQLFVKNLTNQYRWVSAQAASTDVYVPGEPRTVGITLGYHL